ncbi:hypothetical protein AB0O07_32160 [Streptomyces sp. NPDC093085]|uniref:hypothetical protein n=1 Tax=Streptomyces sp. NPDC093085 TaxID=3155068 RepID=UPI00341CF9A0
MPANTGTGERRYLLKGGAVLAGGAARAPGKEADILLLRADALNVAPLNNVPGAVVTLMDRTNVDTVIVAGRIRKWRGALLDVDHPRLLADLEASRDHLFTTARVDRPLF